MLENLLKGYWNNPEKNNDGLNLVTGSGNREDKDASRCGGRISMILERIN